MDIDPVANIDPDAASIDADADLDAANDAALARIEMPRSSIRFGRFFDLRPVTARHLLAMWTSSGDVGTKSGGGAFKFCDDDFEFGSPRKTDLRSMLKDIVSSSKVHTANETLLRRLSNRA